MLETSSLYNSRPWLVLSTVTEIRYTYPGIAFFERQANFSKINPLQYQKRMKLTILGILPIYSPVNQDNQDNIKQSKIFQSLVPTELLNTRSPEAQEQRQRSNSYRPQVVELKTPENFEFICLW